MALNMTIRMPELKFRIPTHESVLKFICFFALAIALYSALTYGQTVIHSDTATATLLAASQIRHGSLFPSSWNYGNGDVWVLGTNLATMPFMLVLHDQSLARMLGSCLWILLSCGSVFFMSRKLLGDSSWKIIIPFSILFFTNPKISSMILWEVAYTGMLIHLCMTLTLAWGLYSTKNFRDLHKQKKKLWGLFFLAVLLIADTTAGTRFIGELVLPLLITIPVLCLIESAGSEENTKETARKLLQSMLMLVIPSAIGFFCYKRISSTHNVNNTVNNALEFSGEINSWWVNFQCLVTHRFENCGIAPGVSVKSIIGLKNFVSIFFTITTSFIIPVLQTIRIKTEKKNVQFLCLFALVHNILIALLIVFMDKTTPRYLLSSQFLDIIISARYIYTYWIKENKSALTRMLFISVIGMGVAINSAYYLKLSKGWRTKVEQKKDFAAWLKSSGCKKGYATYWNAYTNEVYTDLEMRFGGVCIADKLLAPYFWLVDSDVFDYSENTASCLLLDEKELDYAKNINETFGAPCWTSTKDGFALYVFDYDIAQKFEGLQGWRKTTHKEADLPDIECLEWFYQFNGQNISGGFDKDNIRYLNPNGYSFGPYIPLEAGSYTVKIKGKNLSSHFIDVYSQLGDVHHDFTEESNDDTLQIRFTLKAPVTNTEVFIRNDGDSIMKIEAFSIKKKNKENL